MDEAKDQSLVRAAGRYRAQIERVYNNLSLTGLPERDPRLNQLPLDHIFVTLAVEIDIARPSPFDLPAVFLTAIPTVSGLPGLLWAIVLTVRGEKRTLWG